MANERIVVQSLHHIGISGEGFVLEMENARMRCEVAYPLEDVTEVSMGRAGIVLGLEVSRLARNSTDWHRLLEICAITDTLILDAGTMSEAELHLIRARMRGGLLSKAKRGELATPLPFGFAYDDEGRVVLDPDQQIQQAIRSVFEVFRQVGSALEWRKSFANRDGSFLD